MKTALRSLFLVLLATAILWSMAHYNLIDFVLIKSAFVHQKSMVLAALAIQTATFVLLMLRYVLIVRAFDVRPPIVDMMAATFVSVGIGQWAPGAIAIMEVLRLSLMFGTKTAKGEITAVKPRLVVASLYDRVLGFAIILFLGFLSSGGILIWSIFQGRGNLAGLGVLTLFSACGAVGMVSLPFFARWSIVIRLLRRAQRDVATRTNSRLCMVLRRLLDQAEALRHILATGGGHFSRFLWPSLLSITTFFMAAVATWCSSLAIGTEIPFLAICATAPVIAMAGLLPLGLGGMGGYQLISAAVLQIFAVDARVASSANLLQNAIALLSSTALALLFARNCIPQIRGILHKTTKANGP